MRRGYKPILVPTGRDLERFLSIVATLRPLGEDACWPWPNPEPTGYGVFHYKGHRIKAHRMAFLLLKGPFDPEFLVRHTCDNPPCINPRHLLTGDEGDNARDRVERGRCNSVQGETCGASKLSAVEVEEVRRLYATGQYSQTNLADRFGVTQTNVHNIVSAKTWKPGAEALTRLHTQRGVNNGRAKLNDDKVRKIWIRMDELGTRKSTLFAIGQEFGVSFDTVYEILRGQKWTHVEIPPGLKVERRHGK